MTMVRPFIATLFVAAFVLIAQPAAAFPNVDGIVNPGEYTLAITDDAGETAYQGNLDIDAVYFFADNVAYYLGMTVTDGPVSTTGSIFSMMGQTVLFSLFYADEALTQPLYRILTSMQGSSAALMLQQYTGSFWQQVPLGNQYLLGIDDGIELAVPTWAMPALAGGFYYRAQLDDSGPDADDNITGFVPEPATLSLLALGSLALTRRRA